jgi:predicted membrane protein
MGEISSITEHRRIRLLQNETSLPLVLWLVLIVGALVTLMSACLFGSNNPTLHLLQTVTLALLLSLSLVAIADINRPFRGAVHVLPTGIENAKRIFAAFHQEQMPH